jgi:hypothetical protein
MMFIHRYSEKNRRDEIVNLVQHISKLICLVAYLFFFVEVEVSSLLLRPIIGLLYQPWMMMMVVVAVAVVIMEQSVE